MTPPPRLKENGSLRSREESNLVPNEGQISKIQRMKKGTIDKRSSVVNSDLLPFLGEITRSFSQYLDEIRRGKRCDS